MGAPPAPGTTFEEGYAAGTRDGSVLLLAAEADKLSALAGRATAYPSAVQALNEASAILRDAATAVADQPAPLVGQRVDRPASNGRAGGARGSR